MARSFFQLFKEFSTIDFIFFDSAGLQKPMIFYFINDLFLIILI